MPGSPECPCHVSCPSLISEFSATVEVLTRYKVMGSADRMPEAGLRARADPTG